MIKAKLTDGTIVVDLKACARCGKRHDSLRFSPLKTTIQAGPFETLTHWSMCPVLLQPVLLGHSEIHKRLGDVKR